MTSAHFPAPPIDTRERFLRAIAERVSAERIAEIHFFQPIKQGGVESGVAVVVEQGSAPDLDESTVGHEEQDVRPAPRRIVVHTARYRLTLKGPNRGAWETSIVAEADAPLITVDAVVRGVQRRAGDVDDATRLDGNEVRALLGESHGERTNTAAAPLR